MSGPDILKTEMAIEQDTQLLLAEQTQQFVAGMPLIFQTLCNETKAHDFQASCHKWGSPKNRF
jgi:hypothetical protein